MPRGEALGAAGKNDSFRFAASGRRNQRGLEPPLDAPGRLRFAGRVDGGCGGVTTPPGGGDAERPEQSSGPPSPPKFLIPNSSFLISTEKSIPHNRTGDALFLSGQRLILESIKNKTFVLFFRLSKKSSIAGLFRIYMVK